MNSREVFMAVACQMAVLHAGLFGQSMFEGVVIDNGAVPVQNALVELTDQANSARHFSDLTDSQGRYAIQITGTGIEDFPYAVPGTFFLFQNFPNPFNPSTTIAFALVQPTKLRIDIYNSLGQKIKTLFDGYFSDRSGRVVWDATDEANQGVPAGVYVCSLTANGKRANRKMLLLDGQLASAINSTSPAETPSLLKGRMSDIYRMQISGDGIQSYELPQIEITQNRTFNVTVFRTGTDDTITDIDGNVYRTVKIGDLWWTAENLKATHFRNGDAIPRVTDNSKW